MPRSGRVSQPIRASPACGLSKVQTLEPSPREKLGFVAVVASELGPFIPQQRTCGDCIGLSALCRFCCRSPLKASANNDSLTLTRSAAGMGHDGSVGAGSRAAVLFVLP